MPPEVLIGYTESTPKIDVWALGIMLYAMMMGNYPFRSSNKEELRKQIIEKEITFNKKERRLSENCKDIILRMLEKDPVKRISVSELFDHPWIYQYRQNKQMREWGIFGESEDEELIEENTESDKETEEAQKTQEDEELDQNPMKSYQMSEAELPKGDDV
jgi:serine/threonine protein kinase